MTSRVPEPRILLVVFLAAGALWIFEEIHENFVREGDRTADTQILLLFRAAGDRADPVGPQWVEELARDITALGGLGVLTLIIGASVSFLFVAGEKRTAWMILAATVGGIAVTQAFKTMFDRPRPDVVLHEVYAYTSSFPSGHTTMSAITYLTLGALIARDLPGFRLKAHIMIVSIGITLLVGVSRIYLGVHWPSDVLAGWSLGAGWSLLCWAGANWLERRSTKLARMR
jgi:undecaprenyl-diphosphatase